MSNTNTANNYVGGDFQPTDAVGLRVTMKSTNSGGVHTPHVICDGTVEIQPNTPGTSFKVAIGAASVQSGAITGTMVRLVPTANCHVAFGSNPTAVADGTCVYCPAGIPAVFAITSGNEIAVIEDSAAGSLFVTVLS